MLQQVRANTSEINRKIEYISKEIRDTKNQMEILELKKQQ